MSKTTNESLRSFFLIYSAASFPEHFLFWDIHILHFFFPLSTFIRIAFALGMHMNTTSPPHEHKFELLSNWKRQIAGKKVSAELW